MRIVESHRTAYLLHDGCATCSARASPALVRRLAADGEALAVGDWVEASANPFGERTIVWRMPPVTRLRRHVRDADGSLRRQTLVGNVDTALLVMGLDVDFNLRRLERYLAFVEGAGIEPVIALTKADRTTFRACAVRLAEVREVVPACVSAFAFDARSAAAEEALAPWLAQGRTLVLLGSSGAGKSTLSNTLAPVAECARPRTGETRARGGRGRHTTTARTLRIAAGGACIVDTPGLRALRLADGGRGVELAFADVEGRALGCRFRDCRHGEEPGCAVRDAAAPERLVSYAKLCDESRLDAMAPRDRSVRLRAWKARQKEARESLAAKRSDA